MSLMTSKDIKRWIPALRSINDDIFNTSVETVEIDLFMEFLGLDTLDYLKSKKVDYSAVVPYEEGKTYNIGDLVEFDLVVYKSKASSNAAYLHDTTKWGEANFFQDSETRLNELYRIGLASLIANTVWKSDAAFQAYVAGGKGFVKQFEDSGQRTVDPQEYYTIVKSIEAKIGMARRVITKYCSLHNLFTSSNSGCVNSQQTSTNDEDSYNSRVGFNE